MRVISPTLSYSQQLAETHRHYLKQSQSKSTDFIKAEAVLRSLCNSDQPMPHLEGYPEIRNDENFIVLRTSGTTSQAKLNQHPLSFHENVIACGLEAMESLGITGQNHTSLIGIPVGRLSGGFIFCYEVCRRKGWSILPMGTNDDTADIANLISQYGVDVVIMLPNLIDAVFVEQYLAQLTTVRPVLYLGEMPPTALMNRMTTLFPTIQLAPLLYSSNDTGPIGCPVRGENPNIYRVFDNIALEVSFDGKDFRTEGTGELFVTVLMRHDAHLVRWRIGDAGRIWQNEQSQRFVELHGRSNQSLKFQMDRAGSSFIIERDQVLQWLNEACGQRVDAENVQFRVNMTEKLTRIEFLLADDSQWPDFQSLEAVLLRTCPEKWRSRLSTAIVKRSDFTRSLSGKVPFFTILRSEN